MPRRSQDQIAADCNLAPGEKPTRLQVRHSKAIARQREASASTSKSQPPKLPKLKVPQSTATSVASHSKLAAGSSSSKPPSKPKSKVVRNEMIDLEKESANSPRITSVDGITRTGCWETLATLMNVYHNNQNKKSSTNASNRMKLTGDAMMKRWKCIKEKYSETKKYFDNTTGTGLLDKDINKGIDTTEKKKEYMCPRFSVIHEIIGHKANVSPHVILDTARSNQLSISAPDPPDEEDPVIDPTLDARFHYDPNDFEIAPEYSHEPVSPYQPPPPIRTTVNLEDNNNDMDSSQVSGTGLRSPTPESKQSSLAHNSDLRYSTPDLPEPKSPTPDLPDPISPTPDLPDPISTNEDGVQSIRRATRTATKRKRGAEPIANRPMKPLPSVNANPGRQKAPAAAIVDDRDQKRFNYFDKKIEAKNKAGTDLMEFQGKIADNALKWDKEKYQNERKEAEKAEIVRSHIASELADKNINWEREKLNKEEARLIKAEEARVEAERIKTRREVMESCQAKNMSFQEMKDYMDLLFEK
ncbi:hypothetical protein DFH28DRAFT_1197800 [Melampsora americana]|nr:hypothetical protein DFH28DRAFT_1197800 [Melampsora americana]